MEISDIVQLNMLLVDRDDHAQAAAIRETILAGHRPASTLMYVAGLARSEWLIEIDFVAARAVDQ
jgi:enamine deaminase RidA (YjgF/YER057c/UK114 family)